MNLNSAPTQQIFYYSILLTLEEYMSNCWSYSEQRNKSLSVPSLKMQNELKRVEWIFGAWSVFLFC